MLDVDAWIRACCEPAGEIELVHDRPWGTVIRVPLDGRVAWFKACPGVQAFEPRMSSRSSCGARSPGREPDIEC